MAGSRCCRVSTAKSSCCHDLGSYSSTARAREIVRTRLSCFMASSTTNFSRSSPAQPVYVRCFRTKSNPRQQGQFSSPPRNFSQREDDIEFPSERLVSVTGGVVALGKFEALHIGHRELAIQASKAGIPFLLSFVGMAEVLGWELRAPIVAKCDRKRVLSSWAPYCGNVAPAECDVEFSSVRHLSPRQFVEKLARELGVRGVVAGENYRFGYRAAGDTSELVKLCEEYGMEAYIVGPVMDKKQAARPTVHLDSKDKGQVSSTRVRRALAQGDIHYVSELLGRAHRLMVVLSEEEGGGNRVSAPRSCLLNLPPKEGLYDNCNCLLYGDAPAVPCTAIIDTTHIHLESNHHIPCQGVRLLGIEFCGAQGPC